jgi:hypothetical protein
VTTAETSSEPPQPSLLEKKMNMNMTIGWSEREDAPVTGEAPLRTEYRPAGLPGPD